jgi:hypothetical protein
MFGVALMVAATAPAWAAEEFYIVRSPDKKCVVVDKKPTTTTTITIVGDTVYKTRSEAETAVKKVCTD